MNAHPNQGLASCIDLSLHEVPLTFYLDPDAKFHYPVIGQTQLPQITVRMCDIVISDIRQSQPFLSDQMYSWGTFEFIWIYFRV